MPRRSPLDSDFKPFVAKNVAPEVKNAAFKKLFADPHFNVMDGLDTYIDDYSKSDADPRERAAPDGEREIPEPVRGRAGKKP